MALVNIPPDDFVAVPAEQLRGFVTAAAVAAGLPTDRAEQLAGLLVGNDLRGVFSHGSRQIATYARLMRDGKLNPDPRPSVINQTPTSVFVDGDGGLGYFPATLGTELVIEKALAGGIAVMLTRNHGHFGAAGLYARQTLPHDLLTFVTSGHQLNLQPDRPIYEAAGGSPMAFSAPTAEEDPVVLDFGAMHDLYEPSQREQLAALAPGVVMRSIGMGVFCQSWGGLLAGVPLDADRADRQWSGANQGSMVITFRIDLFADPAAFKAEMDTYVRAVRTMRPVPGFSDAQLPGGPEAVREREWSVDGVPVGPQHRAELDAIAGELGLETPWS